MEVAELNAAEFHIAEIVLSLLVGVGLAAACGYRVFVPLLAISVGSATGLVEPSAGWEWVGSPAAMLALGIAATLEVVAYYVPALDNALDTLAVPAATIAGILAAASVAADMPPLLRWSVAVIAGGGMALSVQTITTSMRAAVTPLTVGMGNWVFSTLELFMAVVSAALAMLMPVVAVLVSLGVIFLAIAALLRFRRKKKPALNPQPSKGV